MNLDWGARAANLMRMAGQTPTDARRRFPLAPGPHLFTDWRYVLSSEVWGGFRWVSPDTGKTIRGGEIDAAGEYPDHAPINAVMDPFDMPYGIRIVAQQAGKTDPAPNGGPPGENIHVDGGVLRSWWYDGWGLRAHSPLYEGAICCAESDDGFAWRDRKVCTFDWHRCPDARATELERPGVFIDPAAAPDERYKMVFLGSASQPEHGAWRRELLDRWLAERPDTVDPTALRIPKDGGAPIFDFARFGAVSSDGVHWRVLPEPLMLHHSDAQNVVCYDSARESYVWYLKAERLGARRCIARAETRDFRRWPLPEHLLFPDIALGPAADWYTSSKTLYPGAVDHHLMFPALYRRGTDDSQLHMFSSQDGLAWSEVPGGPVLEPGLDGSWDAGFFVAGVNLVPLGRDQVGLPINTAAFPHKYPRNRYTKATWRMAYAVWPRERIAALTASERGRFATLPFLLTGRKLRLNVRTKKAGEVRVEVVTSAPQGGGDKVLPGRSFEDCRPIVGDTADYVVRWNDGEELGHAADQAITLRFHLRAAELFAFDVF